MPRINEFESRGLGTARLMRDGSTPIAECPWRIYGDALDMCSGVASSRGYQLSPIAISGTRFLMFKLPKYLPRLKSQYGN